MRLILCEDLIVRGYLAALSVLSVFSVANVSFVASVANVSSVASVIPVAQDFVKDALNLGRTHDQALYDAFMNGYRLSASGVVDRVEVITEFRRAVMIVREHADQGEYSFNANDLATALAPFRGVIGVIVEVRLHPLHVFSQPPTYDFYVRTGATTKPIAATGLKRSAVFPPGVSPDSAMTAVRLEGSLDQAELAAAADPSLVVVDDASNILWQARFDVTRFR